MAKNTIPSPDHFLLISSDPLTSLLDKKIVPSDQSTPIGSSCYCAICAGLQKQGFAGHSILKNTSNFIRTFNGKRDKFSRNNQFLGGQHSVPFITQKESPTAFEAVYENLSPLGAPHNHPATFEAFQTAGRWSATATNGSGLQQGDPTTITWSVVNDGTFIPGFNGEAAAGSNLRAVFDGIYGSTATWLAIFDSVFDRWSTLSGVNYVYEANDDGAAFSNFSSAAPGVLGTRGDVRIGGHYIDGQSGPNTLAYNFFPSNGEMVIDTSNTSFYSNTSNNSLRVRNTLAHELGHGLGLSHVESNNAQFLLEPFISTSFDGPQIDDILGLHRLYGDARESSNGNPNQSNDSIASATALGTVNSGATVSIGTDASDTTTVVNPSQTDFVSIDDDSDIDFYSFTITSSSSVDITLNPRGPTYNAGAQGGSQSSLNTKALNNLSLAVFNSSGSVLSSINSTAAGGSESLNGLQLVAGTYYVRVTGNNNNVQLYDLNIGASTTVNPGITLIGGASNDTLVGGDGDDSLIGGAGNDYLQGAAGADHLDGGTGIDIADYQTADAGVTVNLLTNTAIGSHATGDNFSNIENLYGSNFTDHLIGDNNRNFLVGRNGNDSLNGGNGNDFLRGDAGGDSLDGGFGFDIVDYGTSTAGVTVTLATHSASGGHATGDQISNVEHIYGSNFLDRLTGDNSSNSLLGREGNDTLIGGNGNDILQGNNGDDFLRGDAGADYLYGAQGTDTIDYLFSDAGVTVNIATNTATGGHASGDLINDIERVYGSNFSDYLTGNDDSNYLIGREGNDILTGGNGNDFAQGGNGNDYIRGGAGSDLLDGSAGWDVIDFVTSNAGINVDLSTNTTSGGHATGDRISNFEHIYGSNHGDRLVGDASGNSLLGRRGNDILIGGFGNDLLQGSEGNDTLIGGQGSDQFIGGNGNDVFQLNAASGGVDTFSDFVTGTDEIQVLAAGFGGGLSLGYLTANQFALGTTAGDANDRFIYNQSNGQLMFDADGLGGSSQIVLATLSSRPSLTANDIRVI